ncbi:class A beta-lactamase-related serine hydrolase [Candidatus Gracilibacteria bacterium]|nr:class A beta-lactamase-related serine hydrolase [Candidatus Gracilibacteria bacterium]MCF7898352.1 class A beta-lactamase-related serine hydrolase [Candidatus Paceibacterota bacterium]
MKYNSLDKRNNRNTKPKIIDGVLKMKYQVICVILLLVIIFLFLSKTNNVVTNKEYFLLSPTVSSIEKNNRLINFQELRNSLVQKYEKNDDYLISIYFEYIPTGSNISINKDVKMWPASLIKIPIAMAAFKKIEERKWKLNNELVILDDDKDSEFGELYKKSSGTTFSIKKLLEETLINSDNTAHFVLLRNLDSVELEDVYTRLGFDDEIDKLKQSPNDGQYDDNRITAKKYTTFFRSLYNATYLSPEYSQMFLNILAESPKELISTGLPSGITYVHKTGVRISERVKADSGIVYVPGRPYLITVMIEQSKVGNFDQEEIDNLFEEISREIYSYVAQSN